MTAHTTFICGELVAIPDLDAVPCPTARMDALIRRVEDNWLSERDFGRRLASTAARLAAVAPHFHLAAPGSARAMLGGEGL